MSPWRHAPVRRLTWTSHDQHCVTAGRPYKAMNRLLRPLHRSSKQHSDQVLPHQLHFLDYEDVVESESYNWNNVLVCQQMSPWRHAPVRRLTWPSHDQHRVTAGRPYKAINSRDYRQTSRLADWLNCPAERFWLL